MFPLFFGRTTMWHSFHNVATHKNSDSLDSNSWWWRYLASLHTLINQITSKLFHHHGGKGHWDFKRPSRGSPVALTALPSASNFSHRALRLTLLFWTQICFLLPKFQRAHHSPPTALQTKAVSRWTWRIFSNDDLWGSESAINDKGELIRGLACNVWIKNKVHLKVFIKGKNNTWGNNYSQESRTTLCIGGWRIPLSSFLSTEIFYMSGGLMEEWASHYNINHVASCPRLWPNNTMLDLKWERKKETNSNVIPTCDR